MDELKPPVEGDTPRGMHRLEKNLREPRKTDKKVKVDEKVLSFCDAVRNLRMVGLDLKHIADVLQVDELALKGSLKHNKDVKLAWDEGGALADAKVANAMFRNAIGYEAEEEKIVKNGQFPQVVKMMVKYKPDADAGKFWLTNRQPELWKSRSERTTEHKGKVAVTDETSAESARRIAFAIAMAENTLNKAQKQRQTIDVTPAGIEELQSLKIPVEIASRIPVSDEVEDD